MSHGLVLFQLHFRLSLDICQGEPVGSVSLAVWIVWLERIEEYMASDNKESNKW